MTEYQKLLASMGIDSSNITTRVSSEDYNKIAGGKGANVLTDSFQEAYTQYKAQEAARLSGDLGSVNTGSSFSAPVLFDIAPVLTEVTDRMTVQSPLAGYFQKGSDDIIKKILGTGVDIAGDLGTGGLGILESTFDTAAYIAPMAQYGQFVENGGIYTLKQLEEQEKKYEAAKKDHAALIAEDTVNEEAISKAIITKPMEKVFGVDAEADSILGEKMDANVQSLGAVISRMLLGKVGVSGDLLMGLSSFGSEAENAFKNGASYEEAGISGMTTAAGEIISEKISGGIKVGNKAFDDVVSNKIARNISNKLLRTAAKLGLDMTGEGAEEIFSGRVSAVGQKLTYADEKEINELFTKEDAWDSFVGGVLMGGAIDGINVARTSKIGDYASGLTNNEKKVVDFEYQRRVAEAEKDGKIKDSKKAKIYDEVIRDMDTGAISVDTIEEVLGGKAYETFKSSRDDKVYKGIVEEYKALNEAKELTAEQMARLNEIAPKAKTISEMQKNDRDALRKQVRDSIKGDRLMESYRENNRRFDTFKADLSQYEGKQREIIQKAIDSGVMNNTNRSHQFVDLVAKIAADKGVDFDFASNAKIKESGFAVENANVNGYVTENGVTINMESAKALNTVVGHEITHVLEGTEMYDALQKAVFDYAESVGELGSRWNNIKKLYKDADNTKINQELAADLVGDYLFTDSEFINNLYSGNRNIFEKIYDEVKYLCKVVTAGSKEARQLEKVKKAFADAYRMEASTPSDAAYSLEHIDGIDYVRAEKNAFQKEDGTEMSEREIFNSLVGKKIQTEDGEITIEKRLPGKEMYKELYQRQAKWNHGVEDKKALNSEINQNFEEIMENSQLKDGSVPDVDGRHTDQGIVSFDTRKVSFYDGNKAYNIDLSIANLSDGRKVAYAKKGIKFNKELTNKIQAAETASETSRENQQPVSKDILSQNAEMSSAKDAADKEKLKEVGLDVDAKSGTVSHSLSSLEDAFGVSNSDYLVDNSDDTGFVAAREEYVAALAKSIAVNQDEPTEEEKQKAERYLNSLFLIHDMIYDDRDRLDYEAAVDKSAWVSNAEYGGSIDFSTLCAKRRLFTGTFDAIQNALPDTVLDENDFLQIRQMLLESGQESPCSMCYVEGSRAKHGVYVQKWLKEYLKTNPEWKPQIADFTSTTRLEQTRIQHPEAYKAYQDAMNKLAQRKPKEASVRTDYKGEILRDFKDAGDVEEKNKNGGVRFNSFSDFEIIHALDCMQVLTDMARVGLNGQAYTKVKEFAEAFGHTGLKINLSLVAKDVDANGKLIFDEVNGMKRDEAMDIRSRYSDNVGTVIVVFNESQLKAALADPSIDYVLPFHRSQWKKSQYAMMGLPAQTKDFTMQQNDRIKNPKTGRDVKLSKIKHVSTYTDEITGESVDIKENIMPNQYWDFDLSGRQNAERYLKYVNDNGMTPKFSFLLSKDREGKWVLPKDAVGDGYFKLLIDFKMYNNDGWGSPQVPVTPEFNMPYIQQMLQDYKGGHQAFPVANDVVDKFVQSKQVKHSLSDDIAPTKEYGNYNVKSEDVVLRQRTAEEILAEPVAENATTTPSEKAQKHFSDAEVILDKMPDEFKKKHGDKWNAIKQATDRAHELVVYGADGVPPLKEIFDAVSKDGAVEDFDRYMYHLHNIDRMSLQQRFGLTNKPVFGKDVTSEMSRQEVEKLEKAHPEFKEIASQIYAYNDFLRGILVESGAISQGTAEKWAREYPHYVPIKRKGFEDSNITDLLSFVVDNMEQAPDADSMDSFFGKVEDTAPLKAATGGEKPMNPLLETMTERAFQTYWTVAMRSSGDIAPVAKNGFQSPEELKAYIKDSYDFKKLSQEDQHAVQMVERREEYKAIKADLEAKIAEEGDKAEGTGDLTEFNRLVHDLDEINETLRDLSGFKLPPPNKKPMKDLSYLDPTRRKTADIAPLPGIKQDAPVEVKREIPEKITFIEDEDGYIDLPDADSLDVDKILDKKRNPWSMFQEFVLDNGMVFERLAKETKDRGLEADWNFVHKAPAVAQNLIGRGNPEKGVKGLKDIFECVNGLGKTKAEKEAVLKDFDSYLGHQRNVDGMTLRLRYGVAANKPFMGKDVTAAQSSKEIQRLEQAHPEFKELAADIYAYHNHQFDLMVEHGMISQDDADLLKELYPHYVPMSRFTGKNGSLFKAMANNTLYIQRAIALNDFGIHLKNTLKSTVGDEIVDIDKLIDEMDNGGNLFEFGKDGGNHTFRVYENGKAVTFRISDEMYDALKPTGAVLGFKMPGLYQANNLRRNLITAYSPWFSLKNAVRDVQEIIVNSQHARETYATIPTAIREMVHKGKWYQEYIQNGGETDIFFDTDKGSFDLGKSVTGYAENETPLKFILKLNNFMEMVPRFSEYIASREAGTDIRTAMLDASRVTTNFAAGGKLTKALDRNFATFLNASVQGALQHVRNVQEANANGLKGWLSLAARYSALGIPALLNDMIWDDDEEYQQLPDYITENYYVVWKYGDGKFLRLPKGRTAAVVQNAVDQVVKESSGNHEADWEKFWKLATENMAPNNPREDNLFAPIKQVSEGKTWYDDDLIPRRLKNLPKTQQFDEKTDALSIKLSNLLVRMGMDEENVLSPKEINYLLDQYSGVLGDTLLPFSTPKAESPNDDLISKIGAPLRDIFTTDSVLNNRVTGDFYEALEAAEAKAAEKGASEMDKFKSDYLISYNVEIGKLLQQQRDIQTSDLPDSQKYTQSRELKKKINDLQEEALSTYGSAWVKGKYAEVGKRRYNYGYDSDNKRYRWYEIREYDSDGSENYYAKQEKTVTKALNISNEKYWNNREMYDDLYYIGLGYDKNDISDDSIKTAKYVFGYQRFADYASTLKTLKADKDQVGNSISGTKKKKVKDYVYSLNIPDVEKHILFKSQYKYDKKHNREIIKYIANNPEMSYQQKVEVAEELGFTVKNGRIYQ